MTNLNWNDIHDRPNDRMEFGACHVRYAWRTHKRLAEKFKFLGLKSALHGSKHSLQQLLQEIGGNINSKQHSDRGEAVFAAVWFKDSDWAILCDATNAVLVPRLDIESIDDCKERNDSITASLREFIENAEPALTERFDNELYARISGG